MEYIGRDTKKSTVNKLKRDAEKDGGRGRVVNPGELAMGNVWKGT